MTAEISAGAGVGLTVGTMPGLAPRLGTDPLMAGQGRTSERLDMADRYIKGPPAAATVTAGGLATIVLPGPSLGYQWTVRRVTVSDAQAITNACPGIAWVYAGTTGTVLLPQNAEWALNPLPNIANWGSSQLVLQYGESLTVQVTGGTPGQVILASWAYQLYRPGGRAFTEQ
jgi:hypothetical protein